MTRTLLFLTLVLSGCNSQAPDESKAAVGTQEQLLIAIPQDWKRIYSLNTAKTRLVDFVRAEESADAWTTKLSVESYLSDDISGDPISLLMSEAQSDMNKCNFVQHFNIHAG